MPIKTSPAQAQARMYPVGKGTLKVAMGSVTVANTDAVTIQTGLRQVDNVQATCIGSTVLGVAATKPGGGAITIKGSAAGTFNWIAYGS